jgi:hypothetical protein
MPSRRSAVIGSEDGSHMSNADANEKHRFYSEMIVNLAEALIPNPLFRSYQKITLEGSIFVCYLCCASERAIGG